MSERIGHLYQSVTLTGGLDPVYINKLPTGVAATVAHGNFIGRSTFIKNDGAADVSVTATPAYTGSSKVVKAGEWGVMYGNVEQLDLEGTIGQTCRVESYERSGMRMPGVQAVALTSTQTASVANAAAKYIEFVIGAPGAEAANVIPVTITATNDQGVAVTGIAGLSVQVFDTQFGPMPSASATIALTGGGDGAVVGGGGTSTALATLDAANGELDLSIGEVAAASRWLGITHSQGPNSRYGSLPARKELPFA